MATATDPTSSSMTTDATHTTPTSNTSTVRTPVSMDTDATAITVPDRQCIHCKKNVYAKGQLARVTSRYTICRHCGKDTSGFLHTFRNPMIWQHDLK